MLRHVQRLLLILAGFVGLGVACIWVALSHYSRQLPDIQKLLDYRPYQTIHMYSQDGVELTTYAKERREVVNLSEIPPLIQHAFLVAEDKDFYYHMGLDLKGILRSLLINISRNRWQDRPLGGSTITQQVVKNLLLTNERSMDRKIKEALLSVRLERAIGKPKIFELYLNEIFLGRKVHGILAASEAYFHKTLDALSLAEIATLAALPKSPNGAQNPERLKQRRDWVIERLFEEGFITEEDRCEALQEPLTFALFERNTLGGYFIDEVKRFVHEKFDDDALYHKGVRIQTTLNPKLQQGVEEILKRVLGRIDPELTGGLVVVEASSGKVLAMTGGVDYEKSQFNCATQAWRQAGSAFKPIVYLAALERGFHPETILEDKPIEILMRAGEIYRPRNMSGRLLGKVSLTQALASSQNTLAIQLAQIISVSNVSELAQRLGIFDRGYQHISMALGSIETTLMRLACAYATIANGGMKVEPIYVESLTDRQGRILWRNAPHEFQRVIHPDVAGFMQSMLHHVVEEGTARKLNHLPYWIAGKTGTTNDNKDCWFIGFSGDLVVGVFIGYSKPKSLGDKSTGSSIAVPIFEAVLKYIDQSIIPLPRKSGAL